MFWRAVVSAWRSVVSILMAFALLILSFIYWPEQLNTTLEVSGTIRDFLLAHVGEDAQTQILAKEVLTEEKITMAILFLVSRLFILTALIFVFQVLYELVFGRARRDA